MKNIFSTTLFTLAKKDKRIILLNGDLGYGVLENFIDKLPGQYFNCGVAEQNMTGIAAGLAIEGKIPVIYSAIPFVTMRNFEQIRNDICYQHLNVKIVGVGAGFYYGPYGHTHHAVEDIGILRVLPEMTILAPGDITETRLATRALIEHIGPCYIRLGRADQVSVYDKDPIFQIGKGITVKNGKDITIFATSTMVHDGVRVSHALEDQRVSTRLVSMHTIKPLDVRLIRKCIHETKAIFTLEEHSVIGGLGSAVAEVIAEYGKPVVFKRIGIPDRFTNVIGLEEYMKRANGLTVRQITRTIQSVLKK